MVAVAIAVYIVLVLAASFYFDISLTPDRIIILMAIAALATGRVRLFLKDWSIFLIILLAWQALTGISHSIAPLRVHVTEMIVVDKFLFFGQVPTIWLQHHLYHRGHLQWYDAASTILYMLHFVFPMAVGFVLWYWRRQIFVEFMGSFLLVALAGFATFMFFPAAPPWIAANWWHYLPHVNRILTPGMDVFGHEQSFSALYQWFWTHGGWDQFGAMPSEHAAFPFLCFLYARKVWPRAGWLILPYCFAVWFAVVYLGEHYVADVIAGVAYAWLGYLAVQLALRRRARKQVVSPINEPATAPAPAVSVSDSISA